MLDILWQSMGLFGYSFDNSLIELKRYHPKKLFLYGFGISISGMLSLFLSEMLGKGSVSPHTVFFQLLGYYIISYIILSIMICSLMLFHRKVNIFQFLGTYLLSDLPYTIILPFALITKFYPSFNFFSTIITLLIGIWVFIIKIKIFMTYYKLSYSQTFIIYIFPILLFIIWTISTIMTLFNYAVA